MATMAETNPWVFQFPRSSQYIDDLPSKITPGSTSHVSKNIIWWSYPSASRVSQNIIWPKSMSSLTCDITIYHIWHIVSILVGGFGTWLSFFHVLGMSSSQLTNSIIFQRGRYTTNQISSHDINITPGASQVRTLALWSPCPWPRICQCRWAIRPPCSPGAVVVWLFF